MVHSSDFARQVVCKYGSQSWPKGEREAVPDGGARLSIIVRLRIQGPILTSAALHTRKE